VSDMGTPPADHGSDRYDYVEVQAPPGARPIGQWWDDLIAAPCPDCRANVFARWLGSDSVQRRFNDRINWDITIAHDETCPAIGEAGK
jgi:hypothetical protein